MTEKEIRVKICDAIDRGSKMSDDDWCKLMDEIRAFMLTLPASERSKFYWDSCAECIAIAVPASYHKRKLRRSDNKK